MNKEDLTEIREDSGYLTLSYADEPLQHDVQHDQSNSCLAHQSQGRNEENFNRPFTPDEDGDTVLMVCILSNKLSMARNLINCCTSSDDLDYKDANGEAAVHFAASLNLADILSLLIRKGANMGSVNKAGQNLFHLIAKKGHRESFVAVVKTCHELGKHKELRSLVNCANNIGHTPFFLAAKFQQERVCMLMAEIKLVDTNKVDPKNGNTPLHEILQCVEELDENFICTLLDKCRVDVNRVNNMGVTPLHYAARYQHKTCNVLIAHGADPHSQDRNGSTPADYTDNIELSRMLRS